MAEKEIKKMDWSYFFKYIVGVALNLAKNYDWTGFYPIVKKDSGVVVGRAEAKVNPRKVKDLEWDEKNQCFYQKEE